MKKYSTLLIVISVIFSALFCSERSKRETFDKSEIVFIASWNVENLFDTLDDPVKNDEWFMPESEINWTTEKFNKKLINLARVISDMNGGKGPDILGLQEVENFYVLEKLIENLNISKKYSIVHFESPDKRGIDNALLYNNELLKLIQSEAVYSELEDNVKTRDILYCEFQLGDEKINVFVNHWPSRREGLKVTEKRRIKAAQTLLQRIEGIDDFNEANIIIIGDFNDLPSNISLNKILGAEKFDCYNVNSNSFDLYNLSYEKFQKGLGTYKYRDHWNMLDQIIISSSLVDSRKLDYLCDSFEIFKPEYIIQKKGKYEGTSLPTYGGRKYLGGFSDHFSISAKFGYIAD